MVCLYGAERGDLAQIIAHHQHCEPRHRLGQRGRALEGTSRGRRAECPCPGQLPWRLAPEARASESVLCHQAPMAPSPSHPLSQHAAQRSRDSAPVLRQTCAGSKTSSLCGEPTRTTICKCTQGRQAVPSSAESSPRGKVTWRLGLGF